eukprot:TRINITY_DN10154_c0_g2_i4.p1 TRINITY_DN10154_c0_g2~~TRINITY_DN10154_c0_g2_i4.p1  ORF type:complete len:354 (-),score=-37.11 TRINITY_DN10154_c0_g2_i4:65-1126(-)
MLQKMDEHESTSFRDAGVPDKSLIHCDRGEPRGSPLRTSGHEDSDRFQLLEKFLLSPSSPRPEASPEKPASSFENLSGPAEDVHPNSRLPEVEDFLGDPASDSSTIKSSPPKHGKRKVEYHDTKTKKASLELTDESLSSRSRNIPTPTSEGSAKLIDSDLPISQPSSSRSPQHEKRKSGKKTATIPLLSASRSSPGGDLSYSLAPSSEFVALPQVSEIRKKDVASLTFREISELVHSGKLAKEICKWKFADLHSPVPKWTTSQLSNRFQELQQAAAHQFAERQIEMLKRSLYAWLAEKRSPIEIAVKMQKVVDYVSAVERICWESGELHWTKRAKRVPLLTDLANRMPKYPFE